MQIVDCSGPRCGVADDIEFEHMAKALRIKSLMVGPGAYRGRERELEGRMSRIPGACN